MDIKNIASAELQISNSIRKVTPMLIGEIPGASVYHHVLLKNDRVQFLPDELSIRILFLCQGEITIAAGGREYKYNEKAVFIPGLHQRTDITAADTAYILEIQWVLIPQEREALIASGATFPFTERYIDAVQYRDPFKSEKTISRAIVPQRILPRFAMGSVETYGEDLIGQHAHPLLDQFFFSFAENDMDLLLDDISYPMKGNTLLHIPFSSNHGVRVTGNQCAHYIWIDFIFNEEGLDFLDKTHKRTGEKKSFNP